MSTFQIALPDQDSSNSGWNPSSGYYLPLRKMAPNDSTYDYTTGSLPETATMQVKLDGLAWPDTSQPGPWQLTVRLQWTDVGGGSSSSPGTTIIVTVKLLQGMTTIASQNFLPTTSFANYVINLTPTQVAAITDYANLYVLITANAINCAECTAIPLQWQLVASGFTGVCAGLNGTWTLTYESTCLWASGIQFPYWNLAYTGGAWQLAGAEPANVVVYHVTGTFNCMGTNTFGSPAGSCPNPPATVTVSPM